MVTVPTSSRSAMRSAHRVSLDQMEAVRPKRLLLD